MVRSTPGRAVAGYVRKYPLAPRYHSAAALELEAEDGVRIAAYRLDGPATATASIVLVHGFVNSSRSPRVHGFAHMLARRAHVVVPDLRGHGRSGGECTMGRSERLDVEAAVMAARAAAPDLPVVTVGTSLGGAAVLLHAGTFGGVAGVVAISAPGWWRSLDGEGSRRIQRWVSGPAGRIMLATVLRTRVASRLRDLPDPSATAERIAPAFTILVHDPDDWYFDAEHARRLHESANAPKALWWYPGGGHGSDLLTPAFADRLLAEVDARLGG